VVFWLPVQPFTVRMPDLGEMQDISCRLVYVLKVKEDIPHQPEHGLNVLQADIRLPARFR